MHGCTLHSKSAPSVHRDDVYAVRMKRPRNTCSAAEHAETRLLSNRNSGKKKKKIQMSLNPKNRFILNSLIYIYIFFFSNPFAIVIPSRTDQ